MIISFLSVNPVEAKGVQVFLVLDVSGSMADSSGQGVQTKIEEAKLAALNFLQVVQAGSNQGIEVGLISFSDYVTVQRGLTTDYASLARAVNSLYADGSTAVGDAIHTATLQFAQYPQSGAARYIILMTDGQSNADSIAAPLDAARDAAQSGIIVFSVAFGADADIHTCQGISANGHGQYFYAANGQQLVASFGSIAASIISPTMHYGSRALMIIAIPLILFLPEIEKGTVTVIKTLSTTIIKRSPMPEGIKCPECNHFNKPSAKFCGRCATPLSSLEKRCPACGHLNRPTAKYCGSCRAKLKPGAD